MTQVAFGTLFHFIRNGMNVKQNKSRCGLPITRIETISNSVIDAMRVGYAGLSVTDAKDCLLEPGDILFSHINSVQHIGKCAIYRGYPDRLVHGMNLLCMRANREKLLPEYAKHLLRSHRFHAELAKSIKKAVNQASVSIGDLCKIVVFVPEIRFQQRIAEILDQVDVLRAKRRAALAELDTLTQSIFLEMFGDPVSNCRMWNDTDLLGSVSEIVSGITIGRKIASSVTRKVPYLAVVNVQDKALVLDTVKIVEATEEEIARYRLKTNDLLLTEGGDPDKLGRGSLWEGQLPECIHQNHVFRVRLKVSDIHPVFLKWLVGSPRGKRYFFRSAKQTTGIASINMSQLRGFPLLRPPGSIQREFARRVEAVERLKAAHRRSLAELDALFASLQHRAFREEL